MFKKKKLFWTMSNVEIFINQNRIQILCSEYCLHNHILTLRPLKLDRVITTHKVSTLRTTNIAVRSKCALSTPNSPSLLRYFPFR